MDRERFVKNSDGVETDKELRDLFAGMGLNSIDGVFEFAGGENLTKANLASYRGRVRFSAGERIFYLKKFDGAPLLEQVKNWLCRRRRISFAGLEYAAGKELAEAGIKTPKAVAFGERWGMVFEKRSFIITEQLYGAEALERKLPGCFWRRQRFAEGAAGFHQEGCGVCAAIS